MGSQRVYVSQESSGPLDKPGHHAACSVRPWGTGRRKTAPAPFLLGYLELWVQGSV